MKCLGCKSKDPRLTTESLEESGSMPHVCDPCTGSEMGGGVPSTAQPVGCGLLRELISGEQGRSN